MGNTFYLFVSTAAESVSVTGLVEEIERVGMDCRTIRWSGSIPALERGSIAAALLRSREGVCLLWGTTDGFRSKQPPATGQADSDAFVDDLARQCEAIHSWPRDRPEIATHLHSVRTTAAAAAERKADDGFDAAGLGLVGRSPAFRRALELLRRLARFDVPVLIEGETGTGKELFARALHYLGERCGKPFVAVNCGALPDSLLESELFGHRRGAFTDARTELRGLVSQSEGGTLFFDEVQCLSAKGQVTLLRFLQDHSYRPLGSEDTRYADVRVIGATNRPLDEEVRQGRFREDLLYRLMVTSLPLPPLRERHEDIPLLVENILARLAVRFETSPRRFSPAALASLSSREWRGNVRELENFVCREFVLAEGPEITIGAQERRGSESDAEDETNGVAFNEARAQAIAEFESDYLRTLLTLTRGNVSEAARQAGKERRVFGRLMKKHGIDRREFC